MIFTCPGGSSATGQTSTLATQEMVRSSPCVHSSGSGVPFDLCSATFSTPRPRIAHLSRTGVSGIPISSSSSSFGIRATSSALRPTTISVSIDVAACEIAQPRPSKPTSEIVSPSKRSETVDLVAAERVLPLRLRVGGIEQPVPARVLVVVEDDLPVQLVELAHPRCCLTLCNPSTSRSISSGIV